MGNAVDRFRNRNKPETVSPPVLDVGEPMPVEQSTAMVVHQPAGGLQLTTLPQFREFAEVAVAAGIVGKNETEKAAIAKAIIAIQFGAEIGLPPMQSLQSVYVVNAKPAIAAAVVGAKIKQSGRYDYRIEEETNQRCRIAFRERFADGWQVIGYSEFTIDDAKRAGLTQRNPNYQKFPKAMLVKRAITQGARSHCPDVFNGAVYDPEELAADIDAPLIEAPAAIVEPPKAEEPKKKPRRKLKRKTKAEEPPPVDDAPPAKRSSEAICGAFEKFGVTQDDLVDRTGKAPDKWTDADIAKLRELYVALESGETNPDLEFAPAREPGQEG